MNDAATLLNILSLLTVIADAADRADAEDMADFWWRGQEGSTLHLPDGRSLRTW
jgi:hypothetical protein